MGSWTWDDPQNPSEKKILNMILLNPNTGKYIKSSKGLPRDCFKKMRQRQPAKHLGGLGPHLLGVSKIWGLPFWGSLLQGNPTLWGSKTTNPKPLNHFLGSILGVSISQLPSLHGDVLHVRTQVRTNSSTLSREKSDVTMISAPIVCFSTKTDARRNIFSDRATTHMRTSERCLCLLSSSMMGFASRQSAMISLVPFLPSSQPKKFIDFLWQTNLQPAVVARCFKSSRTSLRSGFKQCSKHHTSHTSASADPPARQLRGICVAMRAVESTAREKCSRRL